MATSLKEHRAEATLYKDLATLRFDVPITETLDDLEWQGALRPDYEKLCDDLGFTTIRSLPHRWAGE
jgi:hypothetical protein